MSREGSCNLFFIFQFTSILKFSHELNFSLIFTWSQDFCPKQLCVQLALDRQVKLLFYLFIYLFLSLFIY